jgi:hypothetical protein
MPRTLIAAPALLATLTLLSPGRAVTGSPEGASGKMVLDGVEEGLRKYRTQRNESIRARHLEKLSETLDPRVMIAMGEALTDSSQEVRRAAADIIFYRYIGAVTLTVPSPEQVEKCARQWWVKNEGEIHRWWVESEVRLRRRATQSLR